MKTFLRRPNSPALSPSCSLQQLRWAGHVARMEDSRMPKAVLSGDLKAGKRNRGAPKKWYKDQLKKTLSLADIPPNSWQKAASDRLTWRSTIRKASRKFEIQRSSAVREKRQRRQDRALSQIPASQSSAFICPRCSRACAFTATSGPATFPDLRTRKTSHHHHLT